MASRWLVLLGGAFALACASDPVTRDPRGFDPAHPPSMSDFTIDSNGSAMNAIVYRPPGPGPHPTVVLLHGLPGNERNLDLAQALRRAGFAVLFFHYRGAWGSQGDFSFSNALADVAAAVRLAASPSFAEAHGSDPRHISLVGHSMGGFMALRAGAGLEEVSCIVSVAGVDLGARGRAAAAAPDPAAVAAGLEALTAPLSGTSGAALRDELESNAEGFDLSGQAAALAPRKLLLVAGLRDEVVPRDQHHEPLVAALRGAGATGLSTAELDGDHAFSSQRVALARVLVEWLGANCR